MKTMNKSKIYTLKTRLTFLLLLLVSQASMAEIYSWTDDNGRKYYSSTAPKHQKSQKISIKVNSYKGVTVDTSSVKAGNKVIMYSTSWCGYCKKAKQYFNKNNIQFTEYDIEKNARANRQYKRLNGKGVPLILVGKKRMDGFSASEFKRIYN